MDKKLPNIFANPIEKKLQNVQEIYYGEERGIKKKDTASVLRKINEIFASSEFVYKREVLITTSNGEKRCVLVGRTEQSLLTYNNETILISDILDIQKI